MKNTEILQRIDYLTCRKSLNNLFITDQEINMALDQLNYNKKDLCDEIPIRDGNKCYYRTCEFTKRKIGHFKDYKGLYVREFTENADHYLIPKQHQGLIHGKIIYKILSNRYDWFNEFQIYKSYKESEFESYFDYLGHLDLTKFPIEFYDLTIREILDRNLKKDKIYKKSAWSLYEMYDENYEIYLTTEFGSLYVPIKAILNANFDIIKERMISYAKSYHDPENLSNYALNHHGRTKEEYQKDKWVDYKNMIKPLQSKEAKKLKNIFSKN